MRGPVFNCGETLIMLIKYAHYDSTSSVDVFAFSFSGIFIRASCCDARMIVQKGDLSIT